eukprot:scaffold7102_cov80-Skeletonema_dohrnii-CCMP3373.AAC.1
MPSTSLAPPTFELPSDNSNYEVWCLRAPAHLDISEVLNGVTLNVNTKLLNEASAADTSSNNNTLTKFQAKQDGQDYELTIGDASEINHLRLLLPDKESNDETKLKAHNTPFQRYINLTSVTTSAQEELVLAPARENAPRPAFGETTGMNGSVPAMRLAYVPVPQKEGLKRRWAMPGSGMTTAKRVKVEETSSSSSATPAKTKDTASDSKSAKKKKKKDKKEKKSKKTPKKK